MNAVNMIPDFDPVLEKQVLSEQRIAQLYKDLAGFGEYELIQKESIGVMRSVVMANLGRQPQSDDEIMEAIRPSLKPGFRLRLADNGCSLSPCFDDLFYNPQWLAKARQFMGATLIKPQYVLANLCVAAAAYDRGHIDTPCYRGFGPDQSTSWLRQAMARSGLFEPWRRNFGNFIFWLYRDEYAGNFQYWDRGIDLPPKNIANPYHNSGLWAQNTKLFHRALSLGRPEHRQPLAGLDFDSVLDAIDGSGEHWQIRNGPQVLAKYPKQSLRILFHWDFEAFDSLEQMRLFEDPKQQLSVEQMFEIFQSDLNGKGVELSPPTDPLQDENFKKLITENYQLSPLVVPENY